VEQPEARKEWVNVTHSPASGTNVGVTFQEGNLSVKWRVKSFSDIKGGVVEARKRAEIAMAQLKEATSDA
jgi:hypothetical protein